MRHFLVSGMILSLLTASAASAAAESIKGRLGITGQVGFMVPKDSSYTRAVAVAAALPTDQLESETAFAGGGGLIFGLTDTVAVEAHVVHTPSLDLANVGAKVLEISSTDASLGLQVRNNAAKDLAAYLGAGVDVLVSDVSDAFGNGGKVDTVVGGHINAGGDYFMSRRLALNLDLRGAFFPQADIKGGGVTVAKYDPISFIALFGVRVFLY